MTAVAIKRVRIPDPLLAYTGHERLVEAQGESLDELLWDLDARYPGIRFRMVDEQDNPRPHIVFFVGGEKTSRLDASLATADEIVILQALSGG